MHVLTILVFYSANIYVSLILPVGDNRWPGCTTNPDDDEWFNYQIQLLNQLLEEMCHSNNIYVINHPRFYRRGKIQRQLLARDGLHLNERGTKQLASDILTKLNPVTKQQKHFPKSTKPTWTEVLADLTDDYPQLPTTTVAVDVNVNVDVNVCMNSDCVLNESDIDDNESENGSCTYVYSEDHSYARQSELSSREKTVNNINFSTDGSECDLDAFDINIRNVSKRRGRPKGTHKGFTVFSRKGFALWKLPTLDSGFHSKLPKRYSLPL